MEGFLCVEITVVDILLYVLVCLIAYMLNDNKKKEGRRKRSLVGFKGGK